MKHWFNFQERPEIARRPWYFLLKRACHSILTGTKALLQSLHGIMSHSYIVLFGNLLCFHDTFTVISRHSQCMHCTSTMFALCWWRVEDAVISQKNTIQSPCKRHGSPQHLHNDPCAHPRSQLLLHRRRPYCAAMVTLRWPHCALIRTQSDSVCFEYSQSVCRCLAFYVIGDATVFTAVMLAIILLTHLGILYFSWKPWNRHYAALVWQSRFYQWNLVGKP